MKFDTPATTNPIDQLKVVGKPTDRIEGPLKTTGVASYAYEWHDVVTNPGYGFIVGSAIAKGRLASIDVAEAKAAPGVLTIVTAKNAGQLGKGNFNTAKLLGGPDIDHYHQAIALVVANTFEQARSAASLIRVKYEHSEGAFDLAVDLPEIHPGEGRQRLGGGSVADGRVGDVDQAIDILTLKIAPQAGDHRLAGGEFPLGDFLHFGPDCRLQDIKHFRQRHGVLVGFDEDFVVVDSAQRRRIHQHREDRALDPHDAVVDGECRLVGS